MSDHKERQAKLEKEVAEHIDRNGRNSAGTEHLPRMEYKENPKQNCRENGTKYQS